MKPTVLIVEDEATQRTVLAEKISAAGYHVLTANDGEGGLKLALSDHPDVVILDNHMPNMSGFAMLSRLRESGDWGEKVPVIFFSNVEPSSKEEKEDLDAIMPTAYLIKSDTSLDNIIAKIRETVGS